MNPLISIITVSFNSEKTIEQTIKSVVEQDYDDFEYIIIDGASSDGTLAIIKKYASAYPEIIKYISERDDGIYDAMNKGIRMCHGDLIGIINSDDYYEVDALKKAADACKGKSSEDCFVVYGMVRFLENEVEESVNMVSHNSLSKRMMMHPACFVSKAAYDDVGLFDCNYKSAADYDLFLRLQASTKVDFIPIYEILANFRLGGMSGTYTSFKETIEVKRKNGLINKKQYLTMKSFNFVKRKGIYK